MENSFGESLRTFRTEKGLSQQGLAEKLFVDRSSIASWETGRRVPDATLIARIADALNINVAVLLSAAENNIEVPNVIIVDDEKIVLAGGFPVLEKVMPKASITGFTKPSEALEFARNNRVSLAFLDIEMGKTNGIDLCKQLLQINANTNVIFLTAYADYSFDAWKTGASGFILKPLTASAVKEQLSLLRYPIRGVVN
ncbi:MAG: response regulator [Acetatifactor sp.]|nr:response regulator [Acetatifactor sp.]